MTTNRHKKKKRLLSPWSYRSFASPRMSYKPNPTVGVLLYLASFIWHNDLRFTHVTSFSSLVLLMNIIFILLLTIHFISDDMSYVTTVIMI